MLEAKSLEESEDNSYWRIKTKIAGHPITRKLNMLF